MEGMVRRKCFSNSESLCNSLKAIREMFLPEGIWEQVQGSEVRVWCSEGKSRRYIWQRLSSDKCWEAGPCGHIATENLWQLPEYDRKLLGACLKTDMKQNVLEGLHWPLFWKQSVIAQEQNQRDHFSGWSQQSRERMMLTYTRAVVVMVVRIGQLLNILWG